MHTYPLFLDISKARCLVVGAGGVACQKLSGLLEAGVCEVFVIAPEVTDERLRPLLAHSAVAFHERTFVADDVVNCLLVFAATNIHAVNSHVASVCREHAIPCTVANAPQEGTFITPARIEQGALRIALSTEGGSPALVKRIKNELDTWLGHRYDAQLDVLARCRPLLLAQGAILTQEERACLFNTLAGPDFGTALHNKDITACTRFLKAVLPPSLHSHIPELLHECV